MKKLLKTHFGFDSFRPLQEQVINTVLADGDALVLMPTGGGKSLCFQLPAIARPGITLVVSPLIALMKDQVDALNANGISAAFINSSLTGEEQAEVMLKAKRGDLSLLYLAPERLSTFGFYDFLKTIEINLLAIDEAHCISEWGHDFRPDYRNLKQLRERLSDKPIVALTATATPRVRDDILSQLGMEQAAVYTSSFNRENLHYSVRPKYESFSQLVSLLEEHKGESVIIYCFSRKNTEEVARKLASVGHTALPYHAGLQKDLRRKTQEQFIRDEVQIIVATIAFGMGIDKPDVRVVAHMDLPKTIEGYYQETGRAGRDGLPSECVLFYSYSDRRKQEFFINQIDDIDEQMLAFTKLDQMTSYCESDACRRHTLLNYFGEDYQETICTACDNCTAPAAEEVDATEVSQKVLSAIIRLNERFGVAYVCDVMRGSKKKRILELGHDSLSVHGIARDIPIGVLRTYMEALKKRGYIKQHEGEYPTLFVTQKGRQALIKRETILLPVPSQIKIIPKKSTTKSLLTYDEVLFEKLRTLRKEIADQQGVPPFVIFGDKSLHEMAYYLPSTLESFSQLFGVGEKKLEAFGEVFLACVINHATENNLEEKSAPQKAVKVQASGMSTTLEETKAFLEMKLTVEEIMAERGLSRGTIVQHIEKLVREGEVTSIDHIKPSEAQFEEIKKVFDENKNTTLTAVFRILGEKYDYDDLRLVRLFL
jgi:ATP-dependent DNA helicase RecQ